MKNSVKSVLRPVKLWLKRSPLWHTLKPRWFTAYCVGAPKSGTHSMAGLFAKHYLAAHEPEVADLIDKTLRSLKGCLNEESRSEFMKCRDKQLWLEFEANHLLFFWIDLLVREFPSAKFILTIRDCYTWLDSMVNDHYNSTICENYPKYWLEILDIMFEREHVTEGIEGDALTGKGLPSVDNYLKHWTRHNKRIIEAVPKERLLIVRTHDIARGIEVIAKFLGTDPNTLDRSNSHLYKREQKKLSVLTMFHKNVLEDKVHYYCGELMEQFFPEIKNLETARLEFGE